MLEQSEQAPLLDPSIQRQSYNHVHLHYPTATIQDVVQSLRAFVNSDASSFELPDLVTLGGDSAFYATTKVLAESKPDKREMLEASAIKILEILLQDEYDKSIRLESILLHEWEDGTSGMISLDVQVTPGIAFPKLATAPQCVLPNPYCFK
ncbi:hypothetical protein VKS41_006282 [Umbelopsis sp. WA50703]|jgi:hypothetical protein